MCTLLLQQRVADVQAALPQALAVARRVGLPLAWHAATELTVAQRRPRAALLAGHVRQLHASGDSAVAAEIEAMLHGAQPLAGEMLGQAKAALLVARGRLFGDDEATAVATRSGSDAPD